MMREIRRLLQQIKETPNRISPSTYDTGWLAWLYPECREWVLAQQNPDGSWGSSLLEYFHDRVICTLSAVNALAATSTRSSELNQMERGIAYLETAIPRLSEDTSDLVGFELLLPTLVQMGKDLGLKYDRIEQLIQPYAHASIHKRSLLRDEMIYSPEVPVGYSLEFLGFQALDKARSLSLLSASHGIQSSPAATAFVRIATQHVQADAYLQDLCRRYNWQVPCVSPFETFEIAWSLFSLCLAIDVRELAEDIRPFLDHLEAVLTPNGIGWTSTVGAPPDADTTFVTLLLLHKMGREANRSVLECFETNDHFRCYRFERNISLDIHIHLLATLKTLPDFARRQEMIEKATGVLRRHLTGEYIVDKWHISPYYSTARAVIALTGIDDRLASRYIQWLLRTQRKDGRWTFYPQCPGAGMEETAYVLLALMTAYKSHRGVPWDLIERGASYLRSCYTDQKTNGNVPLWVAKVLYCPYSITELTVLAALAMAASIGGRR
jgi:hypothetical protein